MALMYTSSFDETIQFSDTQCQLVLTANNVLTYTLPGPVGQKYVLRFEYNATANVYVGKNVTPAIPASNSTTTVAFVEYRPLKRAAVGGDVISFITPDATVYMGLSVRSMTLGG